MDLYSVLLWRGNFSCSEGGSHNGEESHSVYRLYIDKIPFGLQERTLLYYLKKKKKKIPNSQ